MRSKQLLKLARKHGTPLFIIDHAEIRKNSGNPDHRLPKD